MPQPADQLPSALLARSRLARLGRPRVPALLVRPRDDDGRLAPALLWMHGRTARKEIDPGRYLRLMRAGIGACAVDLPGHGERFDAALQHPRHTLDLILRMIDEIDEIVDALRGEGEFDPDRLAIGGMSAGGMAAMARLCRPHPFACAAVEAATGSWEHQRRREMFQGRDEAEVARHDPIRNLDGWRDIPFQAIHARHDAWVDLGGQEAFVEAVRRRSRDPSLVELIVYERTGAPFEHAGFGRMASDAKDRQRDFLRRHLRGPG